LPSGGPIRPCAGPAADSAVRAGLHESCFCSKQRPFHDGYRPKKLKTQASGPSAAPGAAPPHHPGSSATHLAAGEALVQQPQGAAVVGRADAHGRRPAPPSAARGRGRHSRSRGRGQRASRRWRICSFTGLTPAAGPGWRRRRRSARSPGRSTPSANSPPSTAKPMPRPAAGSGPERPAGLRRPCARCCRHCGMSGRTAASASKRPAPGSQSC
jgi:hypothetical protein